MSYVLAICVVLVIIIVFMYDHEIRNRDMRDRIIVHKKNRKPKKEKFDNNVIGPYKGAIDYEEHKDKTVGENSHAPDGNPYDLSRTSYPMAAEACVDDEANDAEIDGDESAVYKSLYRNDAIRVAAGTMNRRRDLQKYLAEECDEAENRVWWGRHEE
jgi:hypothetical protein